MQRHTTSQNKTQRNTTQQRQKYQQNTTQRNTREPTQDNTAGKKAKQRKQYHPKHKARTAQSKAKQYDSTQQKTKDKKENATQQGKHNATKEN